MAEAKTASTTARGKQLRVKPAENSSMLEIYYYPGGQVPAALQGLYTSYEEANHAIRRYNNIKKA